MHTHKLVAGHFDAQGSSPIKRELEGKQLGLGKTMNCGECSKDSVHTHTDVPLPPPCRHLVAQLPNFPPHVPENMRTFVIDIDMSVCMCLCWYAFAFVFLLFFPFTRAQSIITTQIVFITPCLVIAWKLSQVCYQSLSPSLPTIRFPNR